MNGFEVNATLAPEELMLVVGLFVLAATLAALPALILFNRPVSDALRS